MERMLKAIKVHLAFAGEVKETTRPLSLKNEMMIKTLRGYPPFDMKSSASIKREIEAAEKLNLTEQYFEVLLNGKVHWSDATQFLLSKIGSSLYTLERTETWEKCAVTVVLHVYSCKPRELNPTMSVDEALFSEFLHSSEVSLSDKLRRVYKRITIVFKKS